MSGGMLTFTKMHGCGNDYIYFNCFEDPVEAPEQLAVRLSDRHKGVGRRDPHLPLENCRRENAHVQSGRQRGENVR